MAISFPSDPDLNEVYLYNGTKYVWDGVKWVSGGQSTYDELYLSKVSDDAAAGNITLKAGLAVDGSVGIGTDAPAVELDVAGQVRTSTGVLFGARLSRLLLELLHGLIQVLSQRWAAQTKDNQREDDSFHTASVQPMGSFGRNPARGC